ncbi:hypothetical protein QE406_001860 [Microbacterium testaceum]|uniref:hypothetical protein n=1 Tax=Microbacterium testaceum TaxID=2033 RepID=UPI0027885369|nr:hypothetical protein [Microbacterium testaceum]MDQ1115851.1 hypothetical protein [Microbacterium testaceum]
MGAAERTPAIIVTPAPGALRRPAAHTAARPGQGGANHPNTRRWNIVCVTATPTIAAHGYHRASAVAQTRPAPTASAQSRGITSKTVIIRARPRPMAYHVIDIPDRDAATHITAARTVAAGVASGIVTAAATAAAGGVTVANTTMRTHQLVRYTWRRCASSAASAIAGGPTTCHPNRVAAVANDPTA